MSTGRCKVSNIYKVAEQFSSASPNKSECLVKGAVPQWLQGSLIRNGPGLFKVGDDEASMPNHVFDGMGLIHKFSFNNGNVTYQNQLIQSEALKANLHAKRYVVSEFGTVAYPDPCQSIFTRYFSYYFHQSDMTDNTLINVMQVNDELYSMTETKYLHRIDPDTLETLSRYSLHRIISAQGTTAHPHIDSDGTVWNVCSMYGKHCQHGFMKISSSNGTSADAKLDTIKEAQVHTLFPTNVPRMPSYQHSFGMTENYLIFTEQPLLLQLSKLMVSKFVNCSFADCLTWKPARKTIFRVISKNDVSSVPLIFSADAIFTFHHINAYEKDGHLINDLVGYTDDTILRQLFLKHLRTSSEVESGKIYRYVFPLMMDKQRKGNQVALPGTEATAEVLDDGMVFCRPEIIDSCGLELPRINYKDFNCKEYQYIWAMNFLDDDQSEIVKFDWKTKKHISWRDDDWPTALCGEPVFVPAPDAQAEDDGIILSPVIVADNPDKNSYLLVLDAKTMQEISRAEIPASVQLAFSFHGIFSTSK